MAQSRLAATLSVVRIINLRAIRRHTLRALLAALSLGGGVAVVVAVLIESTSVSTAVDDVGYRIAGPAPLRIVGAATRGGVDPAVIDTARQVPGVAATVPVIRAVTLLRSGGHDTFVLALGIDCSAQWIIDPKVCQPGQQEPPMMATSTTLAASLGSTATLATDVGDLSIPALQPISQLDTVNNGRVIVLPLSIAKAQFARADHVDIVYLQLSDGANPSEVRARLADRLGSGLRVLTRDDPARGFDVNTVLLPLLGIFALVAVGVGVILIAQITRMSVEERRREIAIAAALGASPLTAVSGFLFEAALLGVLGSVIGIVLGIVIARPVVAAASELTQQFLGVNVPVVIEPGVIAVGLATGVVLAVLAAILPSLSASKTAIATELSGRAAQESAKPGGIWPKAVALLVVGFGGVIAATLATKSGGLQPWQATVTNVAVVVAVVGLLSAAAYLSAQAITSIKPRPQRAHSATLSGGAQRPARQWIADHRHRRRRRRAGSGRRPALRLPRRHQPRRRRRGSSTGGRPSGPHHHAVHRFRIDGCQVLPGHHGQAGGLAGGGHASSDWRKSRPPCRMDHWRSCGPRIGRPFHSRCSQGSPHNRASTQTN